MLDDYEFALCLTHDVDRTTKSFQAPYYAVKDRDPSHLLSLVNDERPYWQFEEIMALEDDLGIRSSFYFLNEPCLFRDRPIREWMNPNRWILHLGRYDITAPEVQQVIRTLDAEGWEVGLHGSYHSYRDVDRLAEEKETLERILGHSVLGGRQHYLNLQRPKTWEYHSEIGLKYDSSLGSATEWGFRHTKDIYQPFDDDFVVFPLTVMEVALMASHGGDVSACKDACDELLREASEDQRIMTVLWHSRYFNEDEFPGFRELYVYLIEKAQNMGGWVGPCGTFYEEYLSEEGWISP
ncbi:polysaccharide deacetylase family protein [Natrialbaceae archaeon A-CW3]